MPGKKIDAGRRRFLQTTAAAAAMLNLPGCAEKTADKAVRPAHHLADGRFRNNYLAPVERGFGDFLRWRRESPDRDEQSKGFSPPLAKNDPAALRDNRTSPTLTWIGHASFLIQMRGLNILTDPHFSQRASPLSFAGPRRLVAPGLAFEDLPPIDAVVVSHNHYDHLDSSTISRLAAAHPAAVFFVPLRLGDFIHARGGKQIHELDWWQTATVGGVTFHATPVQHWSTRGLGDRNETLWCGWMLESVRDRKRIFFAGDTGYSRDFSDIRARLGATSLALLPIGAYAPRWFMQSHHINPQEAVAVMRDLGAPYACGMHWGTFILTDEPPDEPPKLLAAARLEAGLSPDAFFIMQHGETRRLTDIL